MRVTFSAQARRVAELFLTALILSGCTGPNVKVGNLNVAKDKVFRIGIVKAAGTTPITLLPFTDSRIESKKKALEQIKVDEVCSKLKKFYGLQTDCSVDKTARTVREGVDGSTSSPPSGGGFSLRLKPTAESAYFGNMKFDETNRLWLMLGGNTSLNEKTQLQDVIDINYDMKPGNVGFSTSFSYSVKVASSGENVLEVNGVAANIRTPMSGLIVDNDALWEQYILNAAHVDEALERELSSSQK